jgi:divalent metal cation (Fe/Co/Zn/Cd) transporter
VREIRKVSGGMSLWKFFHVSRNSELIIVLGEDIAALAGLALALIAILLAVVTGNPMFDALGSIAVGVLLIFVAVLLSLEIKALITGESAEAETENAIRAFLTARSEVAEIYNLLTLQMGEGILLAVKARMKETGSAIAMVDDINRVEAELRIAFPAVRWCFFEPDDKN